MNIFHVLHISKHIVITHILVSTIFFSTTLYSGNNRQFANDTPPILIPEPQSIDWLINNDFSINPTCVISISSIEDSIAADLIKDEIMNSCGFSVVITSETRAENAILLRRDPNWVNLTNEPKIMNANQGYSLVVNANLCTIVASNGIGIFYGAMTLKQLIAQHEGNKIYGVTIVDFPNMSFRGLRTGYSSTSSPLDSIQKRTEYFAFLKLNNYVLESWDFWRSDGNCVSRIKNVFQLFRKFHLEPIPLLQSFGHGGNVLRQNPYCGEAVRRYNEHFCFLNDTAWSLEDTTKFNSLYVENIGFESTNGNELISWCQDNIGLSVYSENTDCHAGHKSAKILQRTLGTSRIWQDVPCNGNTLYSIWFFLKTHDIDVQLHSKSSGVLIQIFGKQNNNWHIIKQSHPLTGSQSWKKVSVIFNSGKYNMIRIYVGIYDAKGIVWIDSERIPILSNNGFNNINSTGEWIQQGGGTTTFIEHMGIANSPACKIAKTKDGYTNLYQDVEVEPSSDYQLSVWAKTQDVEKGFCYCTGFWVSANGQQFWEDPGASQEFKGFLMSNRLNGTHDWFQLNTNYFNTGTNSMLRLKLIHDGIGEAFFDDFEIKKINTSLVNVDTTAPIILKSDEEFAYEENKDYKIIWGPELTYPYDLNSDPAHIVLTDSTRISDSQIVYISYDKIPLFQRIEHPGYYPYCPKKPSTREIIDTTIANALKNWEPHAFHFGHDEIAFMKTCFHCKRSNKTRAEILAEDLNRLYDRVKPNEMMIWADMLNPFHLGHFFPDDPTYLATYYVNKNIIPIIWFYKDKEPLTRGDSSIAFFAKNDFRTIAACAGYGKFNAYRWAYEIKHRYDEESDSSCLGLLYAKWGSEKDFTTDDWFSLPIAAEFAWHWPDSNGNRTLSKLRCDPQALHKNYGDIFVPRPTGLKKQILADSRVLLTWNSNPNIDHLHYIVIRNDIEIATIVETHYIDKKLSGTCAYNIVAVDKLMNRSPLSRTVTIE